jgi:hypothetical protein
MSSLTQCNRCTLDRMRRGAAARGVEVIVEVVTDPDDPMRGWTSARYSDRDEPSSYFQVLTEACAC